MVLEDKDNKLEKTETKNNFDAKFTEFQKIPKTDYSNLGKDLTKNLDKGPDGKPVPFMKQLEKFRAEEAENAKKTNEAVKENPISADLS